MVAKVIIIVLESLSIASALDWLITKVKGINVNDSNKETATRYLFSIITFNILVIFRIALLFQPYESGIDETETITPTVVVESSHTKETPTPLPDKPDSAPTPEESEKEDNDTTESSAFIIVDNYVGRTKASIKSDDNLSISFKYESRESVSSDTIVKQSVQPGTRLPKGSYIVLTVGVNSGRKGKHSNYDKVNDESTVDNDSSSSNTYNSNENGANSQSDNTDTSTTPADEQNTGSESDNKTADSKAASEEIETNSQPEETSPVIGEEDANLDQELVSANDDNDEEPSNSSDDPDTTEDPSKIVGGDEVQEANSENIHDCYDQILQKYSQALYDTAETLLHDYTVESPEIDNEPNDFVETTDVVVAKLQEILRSGESEMNEIMTSQVSAFKAEHDEWLEKLNSVYSEVVEMIDAACRNRTSGENESDSYDPQLQP